MNTIGVWWADSRGKVILILTALWIGALIRSFHAEYLWMPPVAVFTSVIFDGLIVFIRKRQWVVTMSPFVTGLLIGLIFDPTAGIMPLIAACLAASVAKQLVGAGDHRHVFNPAAFGIVAGSYLFDRGDAWWGATWGVGAVIIITIGMVFVLQKLRRLWMPVFFLLMYFLNNVLFISVNSAIHLTFDGTVFLFAFIMLPEPISSISGSYWRYAWGLLVGGLVIVESALHILVADTLLMAVLAANLLGFLFVRLPFIRHSSGQTA